MSTLSSYRSHIDKEQPSRMTISNISDPRPNIKKLNVLYFHQLLKLFSIF